MICWRNPPEDRDWESISQGLGARGVGVHPQVLGRKGLRRFQGKAAKKAAKRCRDPKRWEKFNVLSLREFDDGGGVSLDGGVRTKSREHLPEGCEG